ncbi:hypothetical protein ACFL6M_04230 [Candidatus Eisenbacteria bacterium]|uniref:Uncharacterized protein n=1 Tax=Eiseniibacteriota bacterium TaxID=2212470 RepID=A0ABV6YKC8_UNCEI
MTLPAWGGGTSLSQGAGIDCTPNPITSTGTIAVDVSDFAGNGLGESSNSLTVNTGTGVTISGDAVQLTTAYSSGSAYDGYFVNEGQANCITTDMVSTVGASSGEALMFDGNVTWGYPIAAALILPYAATLNTHQIALDIDVTSTYDDSPAILGKRASHDNYGIGVRGKGGFKGVEGEVLGTGSGTYYGVYGHATAGGGGTAYGVYSTTGGGGAQYAGFFDGSLYASSSHAGVEAVRIDHPLDPANKYLQHSSVESSDMMNVYNGNVMLDGSGMAWVELPAWFETLNRDFRYQLTCIGSFAPVYVAEEIADNRFRIAGGEPGMKVSWQVTGVRQDPLAEAHRVEVEMDKPASERGRYLHPELYGMPGSMGIGYSDKETSEP